jgi:beta-N-acetylhexosaminidase
MAREPRVAGAPLAPAAVALATALGGCGSSDPAETVAARHDRAAVQRSAGGATQPSARALGSVTSNLDLRLALGQMIVARFAGRTPTASLLSRIRRGEVGGVILFADNTAMDDRSTARLIAGLQAAAAAGRKPRLLILIDQEGGDVKRLPGPPRVAAAAMTSEGTARSAGRQTGAYLRRIGVNVDLAPVADVKRRADTFLGTRAFSSAPEHVARRACAFARGLAAEGVAATLKHFPGLGAAPANTDDQPTTVGARASTLRADLRPYRRCARRAGTLVMMSSARYPALLGQVPAVLTPRSYNLLLRDAGGRPLTVSDDLETPAVTAERAPVRRAVLAGLDLLLFARTEAASARAYRGLLAQVGVGAIPRSRIRDAAARILALKAWMASPRSGAQGR